MMKAFAIALVLAFGSTVAFAEDDDDKVPEAEMAKVTAARSFLFRAISGRLVAATSR